MRGNVQLCLKVTIRFLYVYNFGIILCLCCRRVFHKLRKMSEVINANKSCFQKSTVYASITIFNRLPVSLISLKNENTKFKAALTKYLNTHSFY
jgi:hypothetical protein